MEEKAQDTGISPQEVSPSFIQKKKDIMHRPSSCPAEPDSKKSFLCLDYCTPDHMGRYSFYSPLKPALDGFANVPSSAAANGIGANQKDQEQSPRPASPMISLLLRAGTEF